MNRYNQVPHLPETPIWESDKNTRKHHTQESKEVSLFPAGDHKAAKTDKTVLLRQTWNTNNEKDPQKKHRLGSVSKY